MTKNVVVTIKDYFLYVSANDEIVKGTENTSIATDVFSTYVDYISGSVGELLTGADSHTIGAFVSYVSQYVNSPVV